MWRYFGLIVCAAVVSHPSLGFGQSKLFPNLKSDGLGGEEENPVSVTALFTSAKDGRTGEIYVTAEMAEGWHIYSITQKRGGPIRTKIKLEDGPFKLTGDFKASPAPKAHIDQEAWVGLELEEHEGRVTWAAPIAFEEGVDPQQLQIAGKINAQACATSCLPPQDTPFKAAWAENPPAEPARAESAGSEVYVTGEVSFRGRLEPKVAAPGGKVKLFLTAEPTDGWHIYEFSDRVGDTASRPTLLAITETPGLEVGSTVSDPEPHHAKDNPVGEHDEPVTWTTELTVPNSIKPGEYKIAGALAYQTCLDEACKAPTGVH
ncbi:MAG TPA: protein-disulfide reductase DsbD domain-containing protein, partial [Pirellulales bacterium]|nr:protein-disulfide reductase DsbD domain-containing protein [Pirellulales bacterium]